MGVVGLPARKDGFWAKWRGWVKKCVSTGSFFVLANGVSACFSQELSGDPARGPLIPFAFLVSCSGSRENDRQC